MSFNINAFNNVSSGNSLGPKLYSYGSTTDTLATILTSGYFDEVKFRVNKNDLIYISASDGVEQVKVTSVNGQTATTVTYVPSSGGAPNNATYITKTANAELPNEQALADLATGIMKSTTATGVVSIATADVDYQSALDGAALTAVTAATDDKIVIQDTSDSDNIKTTTVQSVLDLVPASAGTINSGTANQITYYATTGDAVSGLTGANGSVLVTDNTGVPSMLANPVASGKVLLSNTNAIPSWSTTTFPGSVSARALLYGQSTNVISSIVSSSRGVLTTNSSSDPTWKQLTDGQIVIGSTAGSPIAASLTAGAGISITPASNSITIAASGVAFSSISVAVSSAAILAMYDTPFEIIPAPGVGFMIMISECDIAFTYNSAAYAAGGTVKLQYGNAAGGSSTTMLSTLTSGTLGVTSNYSYILARAAVNATRIVIENKSITISNATGAFTTGNSSIVVRVIYRVISVT